MAIVYIFQTKYACPVCKTYDTVRTSGYKDRQYRKCKKCTHSFSVSASKHGYERDEPQDNA